MPEQPNKKSDEATEKPSLGSRLSARAKGIIEWARTSRLRMGLLGAIAFCLFGGFFALWSYVAHLAVSDETPVTLELALDALDRRDFEEAKTIIGKMQSRTQDQLDFGGALFVLGAVKAYQAEEEWSAARQRAIHLVAARYLAKARSMGVPEDRENQSRFLFGQSLIRANQPQQGIAELEELLNDPQAPKAELHRLLADAYQGLPDPDFESALVHLSDLLADESVDPTDRVQGLLSKAALLVELGRLDDANQIVDGLDQETQNSISAKLISGRISLMKAEMILAGSAERVALLDGALADFDQVQQLDRLSGAPTRQAMYWAGRCREARGERTAALKAYDDLAKLYGDSPECIASHLSEAELAMSLGEPERALAGYRMLLDSIGNAATYVNPLVSLSELKKRLMRAHVQFMLASNFEYALTMAEQLTGVFELPEVAEMRGKTHRQWAEAKMEKGAEAPRWEREKIVAEGRYHFRAAGRAYESLAELRYATRKYTEDLWSAAQNYYEGHSFTHAARMFKKFLHEDAKRYQAMALLRLGQSLLAVGKVPQAISTLEECIELYPRDAVLFQARLDCARAYLQEARQEEARELLTLNLTGDTLTPSSLEWRDSLFELGEFLQSVGEYDAAIARLDEAVARYPDAPQSLVARYLIARSYHSAADVPAEKAREAKTESERQKNRKIRDDSLEAALENYLKVQRMITLEGHGGTDELEKTLLRNCYMMQGSVLFQLRRYQEARKAYANVSTLYQNEPFVLESFVHIANCWRRLNQPIKAKGTIEQAKLVLRRLPSDTDFKTSTNFNRLQWQQLLDEMSKW